MKLYELTDDVLSLARLADDSDEDLDVAIADTFEALTAEFDDKAVALVKVTKNMEADIEALDAEIKRLQARKKARQSRIQWLRDYLRDNMEASGITKIDCPVFTITLKKPAPKVVIDDEDAIPTEYMVVPEPAIRPDKRAILQALKDGEDVPGAHLGEGRPSLLIR